MTRVHLFASLLLVSYSDDTKGDWVYLIKLHLQDATGEVDAALFDRDADEFFQVQCPMLLHTQYRLVTMISSPTAACHDGLHKASPIHQRSASTSALPCFAHSWHCPGMTSIGLS